MLYNVGREKQHTVRNGGRGRLHIPPMKNQNPSAMEENPIITRNGRKIPKPPEMVGMKTKFQDSETGRNGGEEDHQTARNGEADEKLNSWSNKVLKKNGQNDMESIQDGNL